MYPVGQFAGIWRASISKDRSPSMTWSAQTAEPSETSAGLRQGTFVKNLSTFRILPGRADLECPDARINDFRGGATSWTPGIGDSVLRENWTASPGTANERAETIRHHSTLPAGNHSARASTRFYID